MSGIHSLYPNFVKVNYTSVYGAHVMTLPTVTIVPDITKTSGFSLSVTGDADGLDLTDGLTEFLNLVKVWHLTSTTFVDYVAYAMTTPTSTPYPIYSGALGIAGTSSVPSGGTAKAVQKTFTWRASDFGLFKLVMLDVPHSGDYNRTSLASSITALANLDTEVRKTGTIVRSRSGGVPNAFLQLATTLNEKLRRSYGMN